MATDTPTNSQSSDNALENTQVGPGTLGGGSNPLPDTQAGQGGTPAEKSGNTSPIVSSSNLVKDYNTSNADHAKITAPVETVYKAPVLSKTDTSTLSDKEKAVSDKYDNELSTTLSAFDSLSKRMDASSQATMAMLASQYALRKQQQATSDLAYKHGLEVMGIKSGISQGAPQEQAGLLSGAETAAHQNLIKIDAEEQKAMIDAQSAKDKQDYQGFTDKVNLIKNLREQKATEIKALVDENQRQIDNYYKQKDLEIKQADLKIKQQAAGSTASAIMGSGLLPAVQMAGNGLPMKAQQFAFLSKLPPSVATLVKGIAEYRINPTTLSTSAKQAQGGLTRAEAISLAAQYDPTFSEQNYASRQATLTNFSSGKYSQNVNSLNTAIGHINELVSNFDKLHNRGFTPWNSIANRTESIFGAGGITSAKANITAAVGELATAFKSSGATDSEIQSWKDTLSTNASPDQAKAFIETSINLLNSRLSALNDTYTSGMGKPKDNGFLSTQNQSALLQLKNKGYNINVDELGSSPLVKLQSFADSSPQSKALLDAAIQEDPSLRNDPGRMVDLLAQNGIQL